MSIKLSRRYDLRAFKNAVETPQGFLRIPVYAARTGVQTYKYGDGTVVREYRPPEEVFSEKTMSSLRCAPLTNEHPKVFVDPSNAKDLMIGFVTDSVHKVGDEYLATDVIVTDAEAIKQIKAGKAEVSMGYDVQLDWIEGEHNGEKYDAIQRNITHNHIALVSRGRGGPEVRLRLDCKDAILINDTNNGEGEKLMKVTLGDVEYDVDNKLGEAVKGLQDQFSAMEKKLGDQEEKAKDAEAGMEEKDAELEEAKKDSIEKEKTIETLTAKNDALESEVKKVKGERSTKVDSDEIRKMIAERRKLENVAGKFLGKEDMEKIDDMSDLEIRKAVIKADAKDADLEGKTETYVNARFDHVAETANTSSNSNAKAGEDLKNQKNDNKTETADQVRKRNMDESENAWTKPLTKK